MSLTAAAKSRGTATLHFTLSILHSPFLSPRHHVVGRLAELDLLVLEPLLAQLVPFPVHDELAVLRLPEVFLDDAKRLARQHVAAVHAPVVQDSVVQKRIRHAVMHTEDPEKGEGEIVQEFKKGFRLGDKVIRFSMVQVAN